MFHVDSEVGRLRQVVLHRPDLELKRLTPDNAADLLFDDVLWVSRAQAEHDAFAGALTSRGVVVHYYSDLLAQTLEIADAREYILDRVFDPRWHGPLAASTLRAAMAGLGPAELGSFFAGAGFEVWYHGADAAPATIEGGDVLVPGNGAVLVGMSERTTPQAVEVLAHRLFAAGAARCLVAIDMPKTRAFMHLDTLLTMAGHGVFTKYAGMGMLPSYTVEPGASARELKVTDHPPQDMHSAIAAALDLPAITVLTAVQDVRSAQREQWDDGCNVLAVEPGVVVAYERNVTTNAYLAENGIEVLTVAGGELGRGRGGPRCMSCPIERSA